MERLWLVTLLCGVVVTLCVFLRSFFRFVYLSSKIPGPSLWNFVTVHAGRLLNGDTLMEGLLSLSEKADFQPYGMWGRDGHFLLIVTDCESVCEVFRTMKNKAEPLYDAVSWILGEGLISINGPEYKRRRRLLTPAFRKAALDAHLPRINQEVTRVVERIQEENTSGDKVHVESLVQQKSFCLAFSILVSCTNFGHEFKDYIEAMKVGNELIRIRAIHPLWAFVKWTKSLRNKQSFLWDALANLKRLMVEERTAAGERLKEDDREPFNVVECMARNSEEDELTDEEFFAEVRHILGAAAESTELAECVCLYLLALHPDVQERVFDEVQSILGESDREVEPDDVSKMVYLEMVIKEAMRLFPPVPFMSRRVDEEMNFRGLFLPKGCTVTVDLMSMHRNPNTFKDPLKFDPERFSAGRSDERHPFAYLPFSQGTRSCPGQVYAVMSVKTSVARIIKKFKVYPTEGLKSIADIKCSVNVTLIVNDIPLRFVPRNKNASL